MIEAKENSNLFQIFIKVSQPHMASLLPNVSFRASFILLVSFTTLVWLMWANPALAQEEFEARIVDPDSRFFRIYIIGAAKDNVEKKNDIYDMTQFRARLEKTGNQRADSILYDTLHQPDLYQLKSVFDDAIGKAIPGDQVSVVFIAHGGTNTNNPGIDELYDEELWLREKREKTIDPKVEYPEIWLTDDQYAALIQRFKEGVGITTILETCTGGGFIGGGGDVQSDTTHQAIGTSGNCYPASYRSVFKNVEGTLNRLTPKPTKVTTAILLEKMNEGGLLSLDEPNDVDLMNSRSLKVIYFSLESAGNSTLIIFPGNKTMLIDGGFKNAYPTIKAGLANLGIKKLDIVLGTHADKDHINGLTLLLNNANADGIEIGKIAFSVHTPEDKVPFVEFKAAAASLDKKILKAKAGIDIPLVKGTDITARFLSPTDPPYASDSNSNSVITLINYNNVNFLFTADATKRTQRYLIRNKGGDIDVDILNAPHHGAATSVNDEFVEKTSPKIVIFSANKDNQFGHPTEEALTAWKDAKQFTTYKKGHIMIETDGAHCTVFLKGEAPESCWDGAPTPYAIAEPPPLPSDSLMDTDEDIEFKTEPHYASGDTGYRKLAQGGIKLPVYTYVSSTVVDNVRIVINAFDVDTKESSGAHSDCHFSEYDEVYLNGMFIGTLEGKDGKNITTTFKIDPGYVNWKSKDRLWGENNIEVRFSAAMPKACDWGFRINSVAILAKQRPIIFVPGIMGSELFIQEAGRPWYQLWLAGKVSTAVNLNRLRLNKLGSGPYDHQWTVRPGKILRTENITATGGDIYGKFLDEYLPSMGYYSKENIESMRIRLNKAKPSLLSTTPLPDENVRLLEFPYDWRLDNRLHATRLNKAIKNLKDKTNQPVILLAHSMGGIISKYALNNADSEKNIGLFISMGTPYQGSVLSYDAIKFAEIGEFGSVRNLKEIIKLSIKEYYKPTVREIMVNMPSAYQLLPSDRYFMDVGTPIELDREGSGTYLMKSTQSAYVDNRRTKLPNLQLANDAIAFHREIASPFNKNLNVHVIVGDGQPTVNAVVLRKVGKNLKREGLGDGTVPLESARLNEQRDRVKTVPPVIEGHVSLPANDIVQAYVTNEIQLLNKNTRYPKTPTNHGPRLLTDGTPKLKDNCKMDPPPGSATNLECEPAIKTDKKECVNFSSEGGDWGIEGCVNEED